MSWVVRTVNNESPEALRTPSGPKDPGWFSVGNSDQEVGWNTTVELLSWVSMSQEVPQASLYTAGSSWYPGSFDSCKDTKWKIKELEADEDVSAFIWSGFVPFNLPCP